MNVLWIVLAFLVGAGVGFGVAMFTTLDEWLTRAVDEEIKVIHERFDALDERFDDVEQAVNREIKVVVQQADKVVEAVKEKAEKVWP